MPVHPCLACVWNSSTSTVLLWSLELALLGVVARLAGSLSKGRWIPCFVPSCGPRAPPAA